MMYMFDDAQWELPILSISLYIWAHSVHIVVLHQSQRINTDIVTDVLEHDSEKPQHSENNTWYTPK